MFTDDVQLGRAEPFDFKLCPAVPPHIFCNAANSLDPLQIIPL